MLARAADLDIVRTGADHFAQGCFGIELGAELIEVGHLDAAAQLHFACVGGKLTEWSAVTTAPSRLISRRRL